MKYTIIICCALLVLVAACKSDSTEEQHSQGDSAALLDDYEKPDTIDVFSNNRFRNVLVERIGDSTFDVSGKAQVFEAAFSWVVEDGHNEIKRGFGTTDAGAPAWGNFSFQLTAGKRDSNTILHLILFESSAKDGSRQHELPIPLY
jgi:hypothetical protein